MVTSVTENKVATSMRDAYESFFQMSKYESLPRMHLILKISGIESPALERIIEVRSLITNCSQNVYVISTMLQFQAFPSYHHMIFTYFQSINICSPYEFVDIPLRS